MPGGNFDGCPEWRLSFPKGGCIEFGEALLRAADMGTIVLNSSHQCFGSVSASRARPFAAPPAYGGNMQQQSGTTYYAAPPTYYLVQGTYQGFQAPTNVFPERPPGKIYDVVISSKQIVFQHKTSTFTTCLHHTQESDKPRRILPDNSSQSEPSSTRMLGRTLDNLNSQDNTILIQLINHRREDSTSDKELLLILLLFQIITIFNNNLALSHQPTMLTKKLHHFHPKMDRCKVLIYPLKAYELVFFKSSWLFDSSIQ